MAKEALALQYLQSASQLRAPQEKSRFEPLPLPGLHQLFGTGLAAGNVTHIEGSRSSGRTTLAAYILAQATARGEICAVIDGSSHFHPESMAAAGIRLDHLVWVRCEGNLDHALRATDLILHAGGFGVVWLDLCEIPRQDTQRIPLSTWHRFRRNIENTSMSLLICGEDLGGKSSAATYLRLERKATDWLGQPGVLQAVKTRAQREKSSGQYPLLLQAVV